MLPETSMVSGIINKKLFSQFCFYNLFYSDNLPNDMLVSSLAFKERWNARAILIPVM